jgi:hypothetical protein
MPAQENIIKEAARVAITVIVAGRIFIILSGASVYRIAHGSRFSVLAQHGGGMASCGHSTVDGKKGGTLEGKGGGTVGMATLRKRPKIAIVQGS